MPEFVPDYPLDRLRPADYNPRRLSPESFERLKTSLSLFGCVKPVILNKDGVLIAGHQRTKSLTALGVTTVPAIVLDKKVTVRHEIDFNLRHNSVEPDEADVTAVPSPTTAHGWETLAWDDITVVSRASAAIFEEIRRLVTLHGAWGSIVADHDGRVILNQDYAVVCHDLRVPVLTYRVSPQEADELLAWLGGDYGVYDYTSLGIKAYNQHHCQMHRLKGAKGDSAKSTTYRRHVFPRLKAGDRVMDFGAGEAAYIKRLRDEGYDAHWYEPHNRAPGHANALDVSAAVAQIRDLQRDVPANGLYDVVVLDSVLNSITSLEFEELVLITCNSLLKTDGTFITGTRSLGQTEVLRNAKKLRNNSSRTSLEFLDDNNFSAIFRQGVWTMQRYHTPESLREVLARFFGDVTTFGGRNAPNIYAVCREPLPVAADRRRHALDAEFNMEYPQEYRHNRHKPLVNALMAACAVRDNVEKTK